MKEQELKLANVKKSCDTVRKVSKFLGIMLIVIAILVAVAAIAIMCVRNEINSNLLFDQVTNQLKIVGDESGNFASLEDVNIDIQTGVLSFDFDGMEFITKGKFAELFALYCLTGSIICAIVAGVFITIQKTFEFIKNSETPFDKKVLDRLKVVFVALTIVAALLSGLGTALLLGVIFWSIYCIIDYGYVLQTEIDETL